MDPEDENNDVVHPEVRAHINSLVSALGGASADDDGRYKLGDDALEVLRDLKKWIRFYDEKTNRMDVARCLAEANLVGNDMLQILALWPQSESESRYKARIALACFEVMVPLTWPIDKDYEKMTKNHHRHLSVLQLAQVNYKKATINFDGAQILHTAIRAALPSMAVPIGDRSPRDQAIIKLTLFFLRNIAMITPPPGLKYDGEESLISRSALIDAFSFQDIFLPLLTIASNMGEDFRTEDVILMEIMFHLVKRVDSSKLFLNEKQLSKAKGDELTSMLKKEASMLRQFKNNTSTRHNRFGSMIWVKRDDGKMAAVSGQDAVLNARAREAKIDNSKKFRPPRRARKEEMEPKDLGPPVSLNARANRQLRSFVEEFLDSGFNPLFQHVRKSIDREAPHVLNEHRPQFFYLVAWFLEAERNRRKSEKDSGKARTADEVRSFNLLAGVLNQEMFITLTRSLNRSYGDKDWPELTMVMRCFTQILLTVQEMWESGNEDDEEIADNILSRLFYEESTHDAVANIVRTYKDQGFEYLDASTEFMHTYLRILEAYSKQNVDLQVRSRKRARRKKKAAKPAAEDPDEGIQEPADESADDEANAERVSKERSFDFKRFAMRFVPQGVVDTFVKFTTYYHDLDDAQLKRAHRYFYRVAFKLEMSVMLFRIDIITLFYNMIKGPEPISKSSSMYKEWEELGKQIIRKCIRKLQERPALFVELLFSKIQSTAHYLEFGFEKQTISTNSRPAAELEFRHVVDRDEQIGITVGVLLDKGQSDHLFWLKGHLLEAQKKRDEERLTLDFNAEKGADPIPVLPDTPERKTAMFKNPHLRLLMKLVGIDRLAPTLEETIDSVWAFKTDVTPEAIAESCESISRAEFAPPSFEDGKPAADQLRRKPAARKEKERNEIDDDLAGFLDGDDDDALDGDDDDLEALFERGPAMRSVEGAQKKKTLRRKRRTDEEKSGPTEEELDERARARRERELEKARKIKSQVYVDPDDDLSDAERDAEFFLREKKRQESKNATFGLSANIGEDGDMELSWDIITKTGTGDADVEDGAEKSKEKSKKKAKPAKASRKRKSDAVLVVSSGEDEDADSDEAPARQSRKKRKATKTALAESSDEDGDVGATGVSSSVTLIDVSDEMDTDDVSPSGSPAEGTPTEGEKDAAPREDDNDGDESPAKVAPKARPRVRAGFIVDSSDEE